MCFEREGRYKYTKVEKVMQYYLDDELIRALLQWPQQFFRWDTKFILIQTTRYMFHRQDFVCYRCYRWKGEDSDKPLRKDIFWGNLGSLYDTFGIHYNSMKPEGVSLKQAKENVTKIVTR